MSFGSLVFTPLVKKLQEALRQPAAVRADGELPVAHRIASLPSSQSFWRSEIASTWLLRDRPDGPMSSIAEVPRASSK